MNRKLGWFVSLSLILCVLTSCMGMTRAPFFRASYFYTDPNVLGLCLAIKRNDKVAAAQALANGVDINTMGRDGMTPLSWAWYNREKEMFKFLLQKGADPNLMMTLEKRDITGTLLQWTIELGATEYFEMLLEYGQGVDLNLPNKTDRGETPIMYAISSQSEEMLEKLIAYGADIEQKTEGWGGGGYTPLLYAVALERFESALFLLQHGADWTKVTFRGKSVVDHLEKSTSYPGTPQYPWKLELAKALLARGAKVDMDIIAAGWDIRWEKKDGKWVKKRSANEF